MFRFLLANKLDWASFMKHIFIFVIMSLIFISFAMAGDSDTFVEITEDSGSFSGDFSGNFSGHDSYGGEFSGTTRQTSTISCSEVKKRANMYGNIVKGMQTSDRRYGAMYGKMERYERLYADECN